MDKIVLIDGNSILNRAFYGIMSSKMLTTADGIYTNAIYGFLSILFRVLDDINPEYIMVAFDRKEPTERHKMYDGYKANRQGMPNELAVQMPVVKEILHDMNITVIEKAGYEADDILGTIAKKAERKRLDITIVSGDRDTFQLTSDHIKVRIPHTKLGKTEVDVFDKDSVIEKYGVTPKQLIEVKGLMGDTSDNIPGVPGIGEKTALELIKKYYSIENLYYKIKENKADLKPKVQEKLVQNEELARLSRTLGTINVKVPLEETIEDLRIKKWNEEAVLAKFQELKFNRFIERFGLQSKKQEAPKNIDDLFKIKTLNLENETEITNLLQEIKQEGKVFYYLAKKELSKTELLEKILPKEVTQLFIYNKQTVYQILLTKQTNNKAKEKLLKAIFEDENIAKCGYRLSEDYVILKQEGVEFNNIYFDVEIGGYDLDPSSSHFSLEDLSNQYLNINIKSYITALNEKANSDTQMTLFKEENAVDLDKYQYSLYVYAIAKLQEVISNKLEESHSIELFKNIEMPLVKVLASMQYEGISVDKQELIDFGETLKDRIEKLRKEIFKLSGEEFNINSTQQLGIILFEKLKLPIYKKTKKGYSTDVDILEKLRPEHPVIEKILEYRTLVKLNSTYVEGLTGYILPTDNKIHSCFHQTITATGRISSTDPNLQNIPTRAEQGKQVRKAFRARKGYVFIDADYSQIELRILAHISKDTNMKRAFKNGEDIHSQVASKVFEVPLKEVTKEQRTAAKAVNFGIVYGISGYGLAEQLKISRRKADRYIEQYLSKYSGVRRFMENIVEQAKKAGYVETLFHRRRYIPEISSNNYMVRQFGARAAMNTPIQGTAADIMKIAMIKVFQKLKEEKLDANIILQIHDELLIECKIEEKDKAKQILKECMENAMPLEVPLEVEVSEADNWYDVK